MAARSLDSKAAGYMDFAVDGAKRMQLLINGLLEYSRVGQDEKHESTNAMAALANGGVLLRPWVVRRVLDPVSGEVVVRREDALALAPGVWASHIFAAARGQEDPHEVVADEAIGQWITLIGATTYNWKSILGGFLLFRLFDIWKPFPVRQAEKLPGGFGIVADDVLAGVYGALVLFAAGCFNLY